MLKCKDVVDKADALVDGSSLSWREHAAMRLHLLICHHCRRYVRQLQELVTSLQRPDAAPAEEDDVARILNRLDQDR